MPKKTHIERNPFKECFACKKLYLRNGMFAIISACILCLLTPKEYASQMELTDEHKISMELSVGLSMIESMARKAQLSEEGMRDPGVYVQFLKSSSFLNEFLCTKIEKYNTSYFEYLKKYNKEPIWNKAFIKRDSSYVKDLLDSKIRYKLITKYSTIKLQVTDNDPEIAAVLTDSLGRLLAKYLERHWKLVNGEAKRSALIQRKEARRNYHEALSAYSTFIQSHTESEIAEENTIIEGLRNEKDNAFKLYNDACLKYTRYEMLLERNVPYFTILYNPTVPTKPFSPVWGIYIFSFLFIVWVFTTWWILYKNQTIK